MNNIPEAAYLAAPTWASVENRMIEACSTIVSCCTLAALPGVSSSDAFRLAACGGLLVIPGRRVLQGWLETAGKDTPARRRRGGLPVAAGIEGLTVGLGRAGQQLRAMHALLSLLSRPGLERTLAAFAAATVPPVDACRWLALVSTTMHLAHQAGAPLDSTQLQPYTSVCCRMLTAEAFSRHQLMVTADQQLYEQLAVMLALVLEAALAHVRHYSAAVGNSGSGGSGAGGSSAGGTGSVPAATAGGSGCSGGAGTTPPIDWQFVSQAVHLAGAACLQTGMCRAVLDGTTSSSSTLQLVANTVGLLPVQRPASMAAGEHFQLLTAAVCSWGTICCMFTPSPEQQEPGPLQLQAARHALLLLPAVAAICRQLRRGGELAAELAAQPAEAAAELCGCLQCALQLSQLACQATRQQQLAGSAGAPGDLLLASGDGALAALQLLLFAAEQQHEGPHTELSTCCLEAASRLSGALSQGLLDQTVGQQQQQQNAEEWVPRQQLADRLRQLHAAACRLVHHAAAASPQQLAAAPVLEDWAGMLGFLSSCLQHVNHCRSAFSGEQQDSATFTEGQLKGMAAAYCEAATVALERWTAAGLSASPAEMTRWNSTVSTTACALEGASPLPGSQVAVWAALSGVHRLLQAPDDPPTCSTLRLCINYLITAAAAPQHAAALVSSGLLGELLEAGLGADNMSAELSDVCKRYVRIACKGLRQMLAALVQASHDAAASTAGAASGSCDGGGGSAASSSTQLAAEDSSGEALVPAEVLAAAAELAAAPPPLAPGDPVDAAALLRRTRQQLLPVASQLAAALQPYWQLPQQRAAAQLQLAHTAAVRSCAYLRCANLGPAGGPDAGQGSGSLRCSACRMVWYCGTACSHADWRAGHKQVCKALAAERLAQRAGAGRSVAAHASV